MASLNKVFLIGNLTRDPELRYTPSGTPLTELGVAVNRVYTTREGERREEATFVDVTVWNRQAETCCQYLKKGRPVHIEGYLRLDTWEDKTSGEKRSKLKVEADRVQFLDSRRDGGPSEAGEGDDSGSAGSSGPPRGESSYRREGGYGRPAGGGGGGGANRSYAADRGPSGPAPSAPPARRAPEPPPDDASDDDDIPF
jgi:single-strand DNA-binding protein